VVAVVPNPLAVRDTEAQTMVLRFKVLPPMVVMKVVAVAVAVAIGVVVQVMERLVTPVVAVPVITAQL
jgi:hypothetical protein